MMDKGVDKMRFSWVKMKLNSMVLRKETIIDFWSTTQTWKCVIYLPLEDRHVVKNIIIIDTMASSLQKKRKMKGMKSSLG